MLSHDSDNDSVNGEQAAEESRKAFDAARAEDSRINLLRQNARYYADTEMLLNKTIESLNNAIACHNGEYSDAALGLRRTGATKYVNEKPINPLNIAVHTEASTLLTRHYTLEHPEDTGNCVIYRRH